MTKIVIKNLHAEIEGKKILKGINLEINNGEVHALLGPNGHGKSTLLNVLMGHPKYKVTEGSITLDGEDVLAMSVDERAKKGMFLAMQYPPEISGVTLSDFLKAALNNTQDKPLSLYKYIKELEKSANNVGFDLDMVHRFLNEGFSGGEKKRSEILQMQLLKPKFALLDEIDSGLDVDALKLVANAINEMNDGSRGVLIVSHYARMYNLVKPTHAHVVIDGKIVVSGNAEIIEKIDTKGYEWIRTELGIDIKKSNEENKAVILESCGAKVTKNG